MARSLPGGLRTKLALAIVAIVALTLGVASLAVLEGTESELRKSVEEDLDARANQVAGQLARGPLPGGTELSRRAERIAAAQPVGAESVVVAISVGRRFVATNQPEILAPPEAVAKMAGPGEAEEEGEGDEARSEELKETRTFLASPEGYSERELEDLGDTLVLTRSLPATGSVGVTIRVGKSLGPTEEALEGLGHTFLRLGFLALVLSAALAWFLAARITGPLRRLTSLAGEVEGEDLTARMPLDEAGSDEVRTLAISFNGMLDRLEDAFERQKAFVADASHDLRTPLTIVRGQIEVLARNPDPSREEVEAVERAVDAAVGRMERLVEDLLLLARSDATETVMREKIAIAPLFQAEKEGRIESERERIELGEVTEREVEFDPESISRALSNLVENALRHAGPEGVVRLSATPSGEGIVITVDDDGPGVPPGERDRIFDRFTRLDRARSSDSGGSGLGLAIVETLVGNGGGSVSCSDSPLGGARFSIWLPEKAGHLRQGAGHRSPPRPGIA